MAGLKSALVALLLLFSAQAISQYDFNSCRINFCNTEETNCVSDAGTCLNYFSILRTCISTCSSPTLNFKTCWTKCQNLPARSNTLYLAVSLCYENVCYLTQQWLFTSIMFLLVAFTLLM